MRKLVPLVMLIAVAVAASGQGLIGKWRAKSKTHANDAAVFHFRDKTNGVLSAISRDQRFEQRFTYVLKGEVLELTPARTRTVNGQVQQIQAPAKLVMRIKWMDKDTVAFRTIVKGKPAPTADIMRRIK